jgi:hypothetical protein
MPMKRIDGVHEVRLFRPNGVAVGYFDNLEDALRALENEPQYKACYMTLNPVRLPESIPVNPQSLTPSKNSAGDTDIERRVRLLVDLDAPRPTGTNSTEAEKQSARDQAEGVRAYLKTRGWPAPMVADSSNGWHVNYRIDLPNEANATALVKGVLDHLKQLFPMVDNSVYNASRICKLYGSWSRKGPHSDERPHRRSAVIEEGSDVIVTEEQLRALAPIATAKPEVTPDKNTDHGLQELIRFLEFHEVPTRSDPRQVRGGWQIEIECPWSDEHTGSEVSRDTVVSFVNGFGFKCFHSHCVDRHWHEFRAELARRNPGRIFSFTQPEEAGTVEIGSSKPAPIKPVYPLEVWDETAVGEFAKLCAEDNNVPRKMYAEAFRCVLGTVVGDRLSCSTVESLVPRSYTVIVAPKGKGKGTAIRRAVRFFTQSFPGTRHTHALVVQGTTPGLLSGERDFEWKPKGIGAYMAAASSVPHGPTNQRPGLHAQKQTAFDLGQHVAAHY